MIGIEQRDDGPQTEAAAWIVRLQAGDEADSLAFDAWLDASAANRIAYDRALAAWHEYGRAAPEVLPGLDTARRVRPAARFDRRWFLAGGAMAAAATVAVVVLPQLAQGPQVETYVTAKGERRTVKLADGSTIDLNAESKLTVTLTRRARDVVMGEGEAVFDVAHDARRPFEIAAADRIIRVVGTQFDVRNRAEGLAVVVARGAVEVRPGAGQPPGRAYLLHPGQRLAFSRMGETRVTFVDPEAAFSWRTGRLVYRDEPLSLVVADLNRHFLAPIHIEDAELAQTPVSGVLVLDDQDAVLRRLALMLPARTVRSDRGVLLQPK